jgi:hypothetical protein
VSTDDATEARITRLQTRIDQLEEAFDHLTAGAQPDGGQRQHAEELFYTSAEEWVTEYFAPMFARSLGGEHRWCPRWWDHAEAISRLEALWRSWETLRLDPALGMAVWFRDHLDHQLPILLGSRGPFARCSQQRHEPPPPLPVQATPAGGYWSGQEAGT